MMIDEAFISFVGRIFPSISPEDRWAALKAVRSHPPSSADLFAVSLPKKLCQGDIVRDLTFSLPGEDARTRRSIAPGMLLSHSCDLDNDEYVTCAPVYPFSVFEANKGLAGSLRRNEIASRLFIPAVSKFGERVVDFAHAQPFRAAYLLNRTDRQPEFRETSFTSLGYYFLLAKLTIHYMRPQTADEIRGDNRADRTRIDRWKLAFTHTRKAVGLILGRDE